MTHAPNLATRRANAGSALSLAVGRLCLARKR